MAKEATFILKGVCFIRISLFLFCFSFFLWVGPFSPSLLTSGGPSQCLNSGPGSEPGDNRGLGSLFLYASDLLYFSFLFRCVLGLFPFIRLKAMLCPEQYLSWGHSSAFCVAQGAPPVVGPLPPLNLVASRPGLANLALLRFYDPSHFRTGNIHGKSYVWQNLISNSSCGEVDLLVDLRMTRGPSFQ